MKVSPLQQIIIAGVVVTVIVVILAVVLVIPQFGKLAVLDGQISDATAELKRQEALVSNMKASKQRAAEIDAHWLRLANLVPASPDLPSVIVETQDAAFASGVQIVEVSPTSPTATDSYYAIPIVIDVVGTWADTVDFLQRLIKLNRGVRITEARAELVTTSGADESVSYESVPEYSERTSISLEVYMIPTSAPATGTAAPSTGQ